MTRVLVMDDHPHFLAVVEAFVRASGYQAVTAGDGVAGLVRLSDGGVNAIVSDIDMPWMNGIALCRLVKSHPEWSGLPVILMTGSPTRAVLDEALKAGAEGVLIKPFQYDELKALLQRSLELQRH